MLHAVARHKTRYYIRYLGHKDEGENCVKAEDEITSTILGPMQFMPVHWVYAFWRNLLEPEVRSELLPDQTPSNVTVRLWPRRDDVEPDAHITFEWGGGDRTLELLIEVKWRAPLSGKDQLHAQWNKYLTYGERCNAFHLFIGPDIGPGLAARESGDSSWGTGETSRLILLSWLDVQRSLSGIPASHFLLPWAEIASVFLERIGVRAFRGFGHLDCADMPLRFSRFYRAGNRQFCGLGGARRPPPASLQYTPFFRR
jgi:hypothetical protein